MDQASSPGDGLQGTDSHSEWTERLPLALLAVAMAISTWLVLSLNSGLTFYSDEWDPIVNRQGWGVDQIFSPFNGHPTIFPMVIYKLTQEVFGMDSVRPVQVIHAASLLIMNGFLFIYLKTRVGDWMALLGTSLILFMGAALEVFLYAFTINFTGALAAGVGAFVLLDRDDRKGDWGAAILLVVGLCFSMVAAPFVVGALVEWWSNPRKRTSRWFVPGIPILFTFTWWIIWGRGGGESIVLSTLPTLPLDIFTAVAAGFTSLFGLATGDGTESSQPNLIWGRVIAVGAIGLAWWRVWIIGRVPRDFLMVIVTMILFIVLVATGDRNVLESRFQLPVALLLVMAAATLARGLRPSRAQLLGMALVAAFSINGGISLWAERAYGPWERASNFVRASTTGIELAGGDAIPEETLPFASKPDATVGEYLTAAQLYGSPAIDRSEFGGLDQLQLTWMDMAFIGGTGTELDGNPPPKVGRCLVATDDPLEIGPGDYRVENGTNGEVTVSVGRFATEPGVELGAVLPEAVAGLRLPAGEAMDPWSINLEPASARVRLCPG